ncbi:MAG: nitrilase-related carbon-nitrogen hydrolase [Thermomicrobiales bacterium]
MTLTGCDIIAPYRAAAIQFEPTMFAREQNLAALLALCEEAATAGARLIVTPEMATTGYCWANRAEIAPEVEPIPGPTTDAFTAIAARHACWIVVGMPESDPETGAFYNSAALIGPEGVIGRYRKTHAFISEPKWAKDGDLGLPVFETPLGRIALSICMDACYPETARVPALAGAEVICFPTNWVYEKSPSPTWMARAAENGVYFIAANRYGQERGVQFSGGSAVIDPDGSLQGVLDTGDGIVWGWIDPLRAREKRIHATRREDRLADRRPDAYGETTLNTYLWQPHDFHGLYGIRPQPAGTQSRVGVVQFTPDRGKPESNLARITRETTALADCDLIVFPELTVTGQVADRASARDLAESVPGRSTDRLVEIAAANGCWMVAGMIERDDTGGRLFNTAVLVGPEGLVGSYRKRHLADEDRAWAAPGDRGVETFDIPAGRVGMLIGYDAMFPEAARVLALDGVDIIACPSLVTWPAVMPYGATAVPLPSYVDRGPTASHFHLWRERERENNTHVLFANGAAPYLGWSGIFAAVWENEARQEALVAGDGEGAATLSIDTGAESGAVPLVRVKDYLRMRIPLWYDALHAPAAMASHIAKERGARPDAWLRPAPQPLTIAGD